MSLFTSQSSQESQPDRWWLTSIIVAVVAMAAAIGLLYLPGKWSWVLVLGLIAFAVTYRLHPARWYRRRAEAAMSIAAISTLTPGLKVVFQWDPDTVAGLIIETGWPAIVLPWAAAGWFGRLDYLSRRPAGPSGGAGPSESAPRIEQKQTGIGKIEAETVHVTVVQSQEPRRTGRTLPRRRAI